MPTLHAKSPCCRAAIRHFGGKRRQCRACLRTWTLRPRRRGRPKRRINKLLLRRVMQGHLLVRLADPKFQLTPQTLSARFRKDADDFLEARWPKWYPPGRLVLISDAL